MTNPTGSTTVEEERIRAAYARRRGDADRYSYLRPGHLFLAQEQERAVLALLRREGFESLEGVRVLDVGCGNGQWLRQFVRWGARPEHVVGIDLLEHRVAEARDLCAPGVTVRCGNAARIDEPSGSFDIVLQSTVFTSILDAALRRAVAAEMVRVVRPDGLILWYDYHTPSPGNPDVRAIRAREIVDLFPGCTVKLRRVTLAPPIARAIAGRAHWLCTVLGLVSLLRTHYLGVIRKSGGTAGDARVGRA